MEHQTRIGMTFIPYVSSDLQPAAPAVPQNRPQAPTVDTRGIQQGLGQLAQASEQKESNTAPYLAPGQGMQSLGQGIASIGDAMGKLAMAEAETKNDYAVAVGQNVLSRYWADFEKVKQSTTPDKWGAEWQAISGRAMDEVLRTENLSPHARKRIEIYAKRWQGDTAVVVSKESTKQLGTLAESEGIKGVMEASDAGNIPLARERLKVLSGKPYADPMQIYRLGKAVDEGEKQLRMNAHYDAIRDDPRAWMETYKERPKDMEAAEHSRLWNAAQEVDREVSASDADRLEEAISTGAIKVAQEVDEWEKDNPRITPRIRELARAHVIRRNDATARANIEAHAPEMASRLRSEVAAFDFEKHGEEAYWKLRLRIAELPAPIAGEVSGPLEMKFPGRADKVKPEPELVSLGEKLLDSMLRGGSFGAYTHDKAVIDKDGDPVLDKVTGKPEITNLFVHRDFEKALTAKAKVGGEYRRWLDMNPKATPEQARQKLYELAPAGTRVSALDALYGSGDPSGVVNDLPDGGDEGPSTPLLPNIYEGPQ